MSLTSPSPSGRSSQAGLGHDCIVVTQNSSFSPETADDCSGPDNSTIPTIAIDTPVNTTTIEGTVDVTTSVNDISSVRNVTFFVNGQQIGEPDTSAPYGVQWDTTMEPNSGRSLTAVLTDVNGDEFTSTGVNVIVDNPVPEDTTPPTVDITIPDDEVAEDDSFVVTIAASDNTSINRVELVNVADSQIIDTVITPPYTIGLPYTLPNGNYQLRAVAHDNNGNRSESSVRRVKIRSADIDRSGDVNITDLSRLISSWETTNPDDIAQFDLDDNGSVGLSDLVKIISFWGRQPQAVSNFDTSEE